MHSLSCAMHLVWIFVIWHFIGVQAHVIEGPGIYYMGIIDALQKYTWKKKFETLFKTYVQRLDGDGISCVDPTKYRERFMNYMENIIINETEYFQELDILKNQSLEKQTMYVYPPKNVVDKNMTGMREKRTVDWTLSPPALSPAATLDLHDMHKRRSNAHSLASAASPSLRPHNSAPARTYENPSAGMILQPDETLETLC